MKITVFDTETTGIFPKGVRPVIRVSLYRSIGKYCI